MSKIRTQDMATKALALTDHLRQPTIPMLTPMLGMKRHRLFHHVRFQPDFENSINQICRVRVARIWKSFENFEKLPSSVLRIGPNPVVEIQALALSKSIMD
jgi:hypothetical protein